MAGEKLCHECQTDGELNDLVNNYLRHDSTTWGKSAPLKKRPNSLKQQILFRNGTFSFGMNFTFSTTVIKPSVMYELEIISRWNLVKEILKQKYCLLNDDDLTFCQGKEGELIGRLQKKLGKSKADVMRMIGDAS